jgi:hypothetical protein
MSEIGASALLGGDAAGGAGPALPSTPEAAAEQIATLKADPSFVRKYLAGDSDARARMSSLHEIASRPTGIATTGDLPRNSERMVDSVSEFAGLGVDVEAQMRADTPVSPAEYKAAVHRRAQLLSDRAWTEKYLAGDQRARREMMLTSIILASKVTLDK